MAIRRKQEKFWPFFLYNYNGLGFSNLTLFMVVGFIFSKFKFNPNQVTKIFAIESPRLRGIFYFIIISFCVYLV